MDRKSFRVVSLHWKKYFKTLFFLKKKEKKMIFFLKCSFEALIHCVNGVNSPSTYNSLDWH